ncbi:MAG: acetyl/propionyl/methylcrotonyl-CoA carboxylase subunit alpha [Hyphomicrobiaceae bacterium]
MAVGKRGISRVLIANRGEIALRAVRAARSLGLETVAVHSTADVASPHVWAADRAVCIGPPPSTQSYLQIPALLHVAQAHGCDAIYPGYGFLSERAGFAERCASEGLKFIGPSAEVIRTMGDKSEAKATAARFGVPLVPGSDGAFDDAASALAAAREIGFPLLLKARAGGGGRGMRVAPDLEAFPALFDQAAREAEAAFGDAGIYLERFFSAVRHIEVQVFGDMHGTVRQLGERDCTVQRRHQKLVEEGPSPVLRPEVRARILEAAEKLAKGVGYEGAGTVEFIYEPKSEEFFFIEMNTRIQVEHPVTEMLIGHDLVAEQFRVAMGEPLSVKLPAAGANGHAIEFRVNAEDWRENFRPEPGRLKRWRAPSGAGIRLDTFAYQSMDVQPFYDSMIAKLIVHAETREEAIAKARAAIRDFHVEGLRTTLDFHATLLGDPDFANGNIHTRWVEQAFLPRHGLK